MISWRGSSLEHPAAGADAFHGFGSQLDRLGVPGYADDVFNLQAAAVDADRHRILPPWRPRYPGASRGLFHTTPPSRRGQKAILASGEGRIGPDTAFDRFRLCYTATKTATGVSLRGGRTLAEDDRHESSPSPSRRPVSASCLGVPLLLPAAPARAGAVSPDLERDLSRLAPGESLPVLVRLRERAPVERILAAQKARRATLPERHREVVLALQAQRGHSRTCSPASPARRRKARSRRIGRFGSPTSSR